MPYRFVYPSRFDRRDVNVAGDQPPHQDAAAKIDPTHVRKRINPRADRDKSDSLGMGPLALDQLAPAGIKDARIGEMICSSSSLERSRRCIKPKAELVLVGKASLDDCAYIIAIAGKNADILLRISVQNEHVGISIRADDANLTDLAYDLSAYEGCTANDFGHTENARADQELVPLDARRVRR